MTQRQCPALLIAAPASGQGKSTLTAALARYHRNQGRRVCVFKTGPDFIDPMLLAHASGNPVYNLDLWMVGEQRCHQLLAQGAQNADLILIEAVMGLFDGVPSSADLAQHFNIPVALVINAGAMAQTFGAVALGLANFAPSLSCYGVVANQVAGSRHQQLLKASLAPAVQWLGSLPASTQIQLPQRHLGILQAPEIADLDARLDQAAVFIENQPIAQLPPPSRFSCQTASPPPTLLHGHRIAVAYDQAFSFVYADNLSLLRALGAQLCFFSPLKDQRLPVTDSLYLPGGYPELYAAQLSANQTLQEAIRQHHRQGKAIVAECGGMLYLAERLVDAAGVSHPMTGLIPGDAVLQHHLAGIGLQYAAFDNTLLRGHSFHYSQLETPMPPAWFTQHYSDNRRGEAIYRERGLTASYMHWYFPSQPAACAKLFLTTGERHA